MARDIEEFLRRAAERRRQAAQQGGASSRPPQRRPEQPRQSITEKDVVQPASPNFPESRPLSMIEESVDGHVKRHIDTSDISDHAAEVVAHSNHLAEDIEQADERMEAHLDEAFDHDVGKLGSGDSVTDELIRQMKTNDVAQGLLDLFRDPIKVRQSILVAEILKRPDFDDE